MTHEDRVYGRRVWLIEETARIGNVTDLPGARRLPHGLVRTKIEVEIVERNPDDKGFAPQTKRWIVAVHDRRRLEHIETASAELVGQAEQFRARVEDLTRQLGELDAESEDLRIHPQDPPRSPAALTRHRADPPRHPGPPRQPAAHPARGADTRSGYSRQTTR